MTNSKNLNSGLWQLVPESNCQPSKNSAATTDGANSVWYATWTITGSCQHLVSASADLAAEFCSELGSSAKFKRVLQNGVFETPVQCDEDVASQYVRKQSGSARTSSEARFSGEEIES